MSTRDSSLPPPEPGRPPAPPDSPIPISVDTVSGGEVIGRDKIVYGDVVRDKYVNQIEVYAAARAAFRDAWDAFRRQAANPYPATPFSPTTQPLFAGRDAEIADARRLLGAQRTVVITGEAQVGKTSLLAAGVLPSLIEVEGASAVHLKEYAAATGLLRAELVALLAAQGVELAPDASLALLAQSLVAVTQSSVVLVLDQLERLFSAATPEPARLEFLHAVGELAASVPTAHSRFVLLVRDVDMVLLDQLRGVVPDLYGERLTLRRLKQAQAKTIVERPAVLKGQNQLPYVIPFVRDVVDARLVPDLDALTRGADDDIRPYDLQIVCRALYRAASRAQIAYVDEHFYLEATQRKGAGYLLYAYHEQRLQDIAPHSDTARRVLGVMARTDGLTWYDLAQLRPAVGVSDRDLQAALFALIAADFLIWRVVDDRLAYALAGPSLARLAARLSGAPEAGDRLDTLWEAWLSADALPGRRQLRYLSDSVQTRPLQPTQWLLLLRAAAARDEPPAFWLEQARQSPTRDLIAALQENTADHPFTATTLDQASLLLGVPSPGERTLADIAVRQPATLDGHTATLALHAAYGADAPALLQAAAASLPPAPRRAAEAAYRGRLADLGGDLPAANRRTRWATRWWRWRRRLVRDSACQLTGAVGGGLGGALFFALWRFAASLPSPALNASAQFAIDFYFAFIVCGATAAALGAIRWWRLPSLWQDAACRAPLAASWRDLVIAGTLGGGVGHLATIVLGGVLVTAIRDDPLRFPAGFVLAAGLSLAVATWHYRLAAGARRLMALLAAPLLSAAAVGLFLLRDKPNRGLTISWTARQLQSVYRDAWPALAANDALAAVASLAEAALSGLLLAVGMIWGMRLAARLAGRWRSLADAADA